MEQMYDIWFSYCHMFGVMKYANMKELPSGALFDNGLLGLRNKWNLMKIVL